MIEVVGAVFVRDGATLLGLRSACKRSFPDCWDVIGGHVEPGETAAQAMAREVAEEIGVIPTAFSELGVFDYDDPAEGSSRPVLFRIQAWRGEPWLANDEHTELRWLSPADLMAADNLAFAEYRDALIGALTSG